MMLKPSFNSSTIDINLELLEYLFENIYCFRLLKKNPIASYHLLCQVKIAKATDINNEIAKSKKFSLIKLLNSRKYIIKNVSNIKIKNIISFVKRLNFEYNSNKKPLLGLSTKPCNIAKSTNSRISIAMSMPY